MERWLRFYRYLRDMEPRLDSDMSGEMLEGEVALKSARLRLVELRSDGQALLELLEYRAPHPNEWSDDLHPCDTGAHHIALGVEYADATYERLRAAGAQFTWPPQEVVDTGFFAGHRTAYCYDPDHLIVEPWQAVG